MVYVYVLYSKQAKYFYKGKTADLKIRINQHNKGEVKSTKSGRPWKLVYYQSFLNSTDATREELFLKSGKGKERLKYLLRETMKLFNGQE